MRGFKMKLAVGNLFSSHDDYIFVTTNSFVKKNGNLVMGRGAALELARLRPDVPSIFGGAVLHLCGNLGKYGVFWSLIRYDAVSPFYGAFQVKYNWYENADLELIRFSTEELNRHVQGVLEGSTISVNFPGIGNGNLKYEDVLPIIEILPDNVTFYIKEKI